MFPPLIRLAPFLLRPQVFWQRQRRPVLRTFLRDTLILQFDMHTEPSSTSRGSRSGNRYALKFSSRSLNLFFLLTDKLLDVAPIYTSRRDLVLRSPRPCPLCNVDVVSLLCFAFHGIPAGVVVVCGFSKSCFVVREILVDVDIACVCFSCFDYFSVDVSTHLEPPFVIGVHRHQAVGIRTVQEVVDTPARKDFGHWV